MKRINIKDLARLAGVSTGTVDRALNNKPGISPETRSLILKIAEENNYKPNKVARSLVLRSKKFRIGVICPKSPGFFWDSVMNGVKAAAGEFFDLGVEIVFKDLEMQREVEDITRCIDQLLIENVDAIVLVPVNSSVLIDKIREVAAKEVVVVTLNDDIDTPDRLFYVGPQMRQSGRVAGELMVKFLNGKGKVITTNSEIPSLDYRERLEGFTEVLQESGKDISIVANYSYNYKKLVDDGGVLLKNLLQEAGDIDGIYDTVGGRLMHIAKVVRECPNLGRVRLIGHEVWSGVQEFIEDGTIDACINQESFSQGYYVVKLLCDYLVDGRKPGFDRMYTRIDIILKENMVKQPNIINL